MAGVIIDIPGIGNVEAKNAATEATLREILKALGGGGGGGAGGGATGGGGAGGGGGAAGSAKSFNLLGIASNALGKSLKAVGFVAGATVGTVGLLKDGTKAAAGAAVGLSEAAIGAVNSLSRLDGSASGVADIFGSIPLFGPLFKAVAGAADDVVKSYQSVAQSGATFGGSISNFSRAASEAGMTMDQFAGIIKSNGAGMLGFGATVESGAANFAKVSKQLRTTGADLYALGFSTQEINTGLANYGALLRQQGLQGKQSNAELVNGAKKYLKEMDALAKITGEERSAKEAQAKQLANDAQFQAAMAGMNEEVRASFRDTVLGLPGPLQNFTKDILANGVATTEETQKLMAMMPQSAAMLQKLNAKMQKGEQVTMEERNALNNLMRQEGGKQLQSIKQAGAASGDLAGVVNGLAATQQINADAVKQATAEQKKAQAETDKMNEKMSQFQQAIAEVSNKFKMLLANSGILDVLMQAFSGVVNLANTFLVPAFNLIVSAAMKIWEGFKLLLAPVVEYLSEKFGATGLGGTVQFIDGLFNAVFPVMAGVVRGAILAFEGLYNGVQQILQPLRELMSSLFGVSRETEGFGKVLVDVGAFVGEVFQVLGTAIGALIKAIDMFLVPIIKVTLVPVFQALWAVTKGVINGFAGFMDMLQDVGTFFDGMFDAIMFGLNKLTRGLVGINEEEYKKRQEDREKLKKEREEERAARKVEVGEKKDQYKKEIDQDSKKFKEQKLTHDRLTNAAKKEADAKEAAVKAQEKLLDYSAGPEELLKQFSSKEKGTIEIGVKKDEASREKSIADKELLEAKTTAEKKAALEKIEAAEKKLKALEGAEKVKKDIESDAAKKTEDAAKKAAEEEQKKIKDEQGKGQQPTQESAESLLAQLNTNMTHLIRISEEQKNIGERQLSVQRGLNKDLFAAV